MVDSSDAIEFHAIAAMCNENRGIGMNNDLPWSVPDDYNYFLRVATTTRDKSKVNAFIFGRLSWESIPIDHRPIRPGITIIISSKMTNNDIKLGGGSDPDSVIVLKSIAEGLEHIRTSYKDRVETIYCCGGSAIYR